jgi:hypothetical protein
MVLVQHVAELENAKPETIRNGKMTVNSSRVAPSSSRPQAARRNQTSQSTSHRHRYLLPVKLHPVASDRVVARIDEIDDFDIDGFRARSRLL